MISFRFAKVSRRHGIRWSRANFEMICGEQQIIEESNDNTKSYGQKANNNEIIDRI